MSNLVSRGIQIWRRDGFESFIRELAYWGHGRVRNFLPEQLYLLVMPERLSVELNGTTADFDTRFVPRGDIGVEKPVLGRFLELVEDDDNFFDVGANVGLYSAFFGRNLEDVNVFAFEPNPSALVLLESNLQFNCANYRMFSLALSNSPGYAEIDVEFTTMADISDEGDTVVKTERFDQVVEELSLPSPDVVKIDVEGMEREVLEGFGDLLSDIAVLVLEIHDGNGETRKSDDEIVQVLGEHFETVESIDHELPTDSRRHVVASSR